MASGWAQCISKAIVAAHTSVPVWGAVTQLHPGWAGAHWTGQCFILESGCPETAQAVNTTPVTGRGFPLCPIAWIFWSGKENAAWKTVCLMLFFAPFPCLLWVKINSEESSSSVSLIPDVVICIVIASMGPGHMDLMPAQTHHRGFRDHQAHTAETRNLSLQLQPYLVGTTHTHWPGVMQLTWLY